MIDFSPPDKPSKPKLSINKEHPIEGDRIKLICSPTTVDNAHYQFWRDGNILRNGTTSNTYIIRSAHLGNDSGEYTCVATVGNIHSDSSNTVNIKGKTYWNYSIV